MTEHMWEKLKNKQTQRVGWSGEYTFSAQQAGWESLSYVIIGGRVI